MNLLLLAAALTVSESVISVTEDGPRAGEAYRFQQGDAVFFRARVAGYTRHKDEDDRENMAIAWNVQVFDPQGVPLVPPKSGKVAVDLAPQDKEWTPRVRHEFPLPPLVDPGDYRILFAAKDEIGGGEAKSETVFRVRGRVVEPSDALTIRNFRFLRSEEDGPAMITPAYHGGDEVWARFDITGYRIGEGNRYEVGYGLEVFDASGKSIYTQPEAARESGEGFYRKRYVPGVLNLRPSVDIAKGEYSVALRVRDIVGAAESESRRVFRIE
ncbi:MAG: hypothetical protein R2729_20805 [Bryobacteraceae bacterium]